MTLVEFKKYLERKIAYYESHMKEIESRDRFDIETWGRLSARKSTTEAILEAFKLEVLEKNEKDA